MKTHEMILHGEYNFTNQPERLKYIGHNFSGNGYWHQFEKVGVQGVWCELQDQDLELIEAGREAGYGNMAVGFKSKKPSSMTRNQRKRLSN